jgi:hypothetical protein
MYDYYCYAFALSAMIQFASLMYVTYARPFKSALHNVIVIFEDAMTLICFIILFRYSNKDSVQSIDVSRATAKQFSLMVLILTMVPPILAFMEFIRLLR